jgi:predicted nucleic acid-binding protein
VLLDTGCIVALLDRAEQHHEECGRVLSTLREPLLTCEAVIAESCYLLRGVADANTKLLKNIERGLFQMPYRLAERAAHVAKLMTKYANVPMDLADACLVDMASEFQTGRVLTLDHDFQVYRWGKKRAFDLLLAI